MYAQNIFHPNQYTHGHNWSWTIAHCHRTRADAKVFTGLKTRWWSVPSFSIWTEYTKVLIVHTDKNLKDWIRWTCELHLKTFYECVFFHFFLWGNHSWYFFKYFGYTLYILLLLPGTTFHTHTKQQAILFFSFSQYLRLRLAKCRHQIYNLKRSRNTPKSFCSKFVSC
jgi:hypothetical protein